MSVEVPPQPRRGGGTSPFGWVLWGVLLLLVAPRVGATEAELSRLEDEIARLSKLAGGTVGIGVLHLESGLEAYLNPDEPFPMASSYKVPVAVQLLTRVDEAELSLDEMIELSPGDLHPGSGTLSALFDDPGVILSLRNLLELMLLISDNSATDLVLEAAGGGAAVTERMAALGFASIRVDRPTELLIADYLGVEDLGPEGERTKEKFARLAGRISVDRSLDARRTFDLDPRDTATPRALTALLRGLWQGELLSKSSTALLLDIMGRSTTGSSRIKGLLPPETHVAHKTGTIGGTTNDIGIVELPDDSGHVVIVALVKASTLDVAVRESAIAHIARAVYDFFLFRRPASEPQP